MSDPKAEEAKKKVLEALKKQKATKIDVSKLDAVAREGATLKGDKESD